MVGMFMMQSMAIHPGDRIYINREGVVHDGDGFYEPFLIVERTVSDSQMKNVGQIQPAKKPAKDKISSAYQNSSPRSQMSWGGIHTSKHVGKNNQIACDVVYFHDDSWWVIQTEIEAPFKSQVKVEKPMARSSSTAGVFCGGHGFSA
jgi:hypothetical protein